MFAEIFVILICFAIGFLAIGAWQKNYYFFLFGGIIFTVVGLLVYATGYQTSQITNFVTTKSIAPDGNTQWSSVPVYETLTQDKDSGVWALGWGMIFLGATFLLGSFGYILQDYREGKRQRQS